MVQALIYMAKIMDKQPSLGLRKNLEALILPDQIVIYAQNIDDVLPDLKAKLEAFGISIKVDFESPCG